MPITSAILAGGESRRMGADKAMLQMGGESLLARTARILNDGGGRVLVAGRARPQDWRLPGVDFVPDTQPGLGPLGGLETVLRHAGGTVLVVSCDLPLLTANAVRWLQGQTEQNSEHGVVVVNGTQWEPLFSIYRPACLSLIASYLAENRRSLHGLIKAGQFTFVQAPDWVAKTLINVNTPEDWQQVERQESEN